MNSEEYEQLLSDTDKQIDRLHALYEQWFQGIERREPAKQREILHKRLETLRVNMPRNTALRFRCQGLLARWVTLTHHWTKIARQIEEGTYKRDVFRARKKADERAAREKQAARREALAAAEAARAESRAHSADPHQGAIPSNLGASAVRPAEPGLDPNAPRLPPSLSNFDDETGAAVVVPRFSGAVPSTSGAVPGMPARPVAPGAPARPGAPVAPARPAAPAAPARPNAPTAPTPLAAPAAPARPVPPAPPAVARPVPPAPPAPARPAPPAPPAAVRPVPPAPPAPPSRPEPASPALQPLFERYVEAKRRNNENVDNVRIESLASSIDRMLPDLQKKHAGKQIDFEVVVKDGRVGLKPVPK